MFYDFKFEKKYMSIFEKIGVHVGSLLKEAHIPANVLKAHNYQLTHDQYKQILQAFDQQVNLDLLVEVSKVDSIAMFVPEFFVGLCADNGLNCIKRIAKYKKMIAPVRMIVETTADMTAISYRYNDESELPRAVQINAYISILSIIRQGTGLKELSPIMLLTKDHYPKSVEAYIGIRPTFSYQSKIVFSNKDLERPFVTKNNRMWEYLEVKLNHRLNKIEDDARFTRVVRKALLELVPSGVSDMEAIALELGVSTRTLGRRLNEEGTTYKKQLNYIREVLVCNYLKAGMSLDEIAFLVNYLDAKSLSRAFKAWTGISVSEYRKNSMSDENRVIEV